MQVNAESPKTLTRRPREDKEGAEEQSDDKTRDSATKRARLDAAPSPVKKPARDHMHVMTLQDDVLVVTPPSLASQSPNVYSLSLTHKRLVHRCVMLAHRLTR